MNPVKGGKFEGFVKWCMRRLELVWRWALVGRLFPYLWNDLIPLRIRYERNLFLKRTGCSAVCASVVPSKEEPRN